jgi:hypothetical protein
MENIIVDKTFIFALSIVDYCELLESKRQICNLKTTT